MQKFALTKIDRLFLSQSIRGAIAADKQTIVSQNRPYNQGHVAFPPFYVP